MFIYQAIRFPSLYGLAKEESDRVCISYENSNDSSSLSMLVLTDSIGVTRHRYLFLF
jgi:hypothetical protein